IYTRFKISFWKQDPPKPTEAFKNFGPIRESIPTALATSSTLAPVTSQSSETALIEETRCARNALATSFDNSDDQRFVVKIRSRGTQRAYICTNASIASTFSPPINTRSGLYKSSIAVPSAKNSGLERTWKL